MSLIKQKLRNQKIYTNYTVKCIHHGTLKKKLKEIISVSTAYSEQLWDQI